MARSTGTYYRNLDGWRGYAVLWIALGHAVYVFDLNFVRHPSLLFTGGSTRWAVDIFFIISGFVITAKLFRDGDRFTLKGFLVNRALRVLPLYIAIVGLAAFADAVTPPMQIEVVKTVPARALTCGESVTGLVAGLGRDVPGRTLHAAFPLKISGASYLQDLFLVQNYFPMGQRVRLLEHTWFIAAIVHFYLFYGLLVQVIFRSASDLKKRRTITLSILAGLMVLVAVIRASFGPQYGSYDQMTHFRIDSFFLGCVMALAWGGRDKLPRPVAPLVFGVGAILLASIVLTWPPVDLMRSSAPLVISMLALGCMLLATIVPSPAADLVFGNRVITWIGRYAYGIYLVHYPFMLYFVIFSKRMHWGSAFSLPFFLIAAVLLGAGLQGAFDRFQVVGQRA